MMMPANFSAISENEMTYVSGGASLSDILAPSLTLANWQKFNKNMVTIIGNSFLGSYVNNTVGTLFSGAYRPGNLGRAWFNGVAHAYDTGSQVFLDSTFSRLPGLDVANGVLNAGLRIVGSAAAVYNLATANTGKKMPSLFDFEKNETVFPKD